MILVRRLVVCAALVAAGSGCARLQGGGATPTKAEYVAAADQVCAEAETAIDEVEVEAMENPDPARDQRWVRAELVPAYRGMVGALRGIPPPDTDGAYLADLYDDLDHAIEILRQSPSLGRARVRDDTDIRNRFSSYGMKVCGRV